MTAACIQFTQLLLLHILLFSFKGHRHQPHRPPLTIADSLTGHHSQPSRPTVTPSPYSLLLLHGSPLTASPVNTHHRRQPHRSRLTTLMASPVTTADILTGQLSGTTVTFVIIEGFIVTVALVSDFRCILESTYGSLYYLLAYHRFETMKKRRNVLLLKWW